jgi:hypothetical protein
MTDTQIKLLRGKLTDEIDRQTDETTGTGSQFRSGFKNTDYCSSQIKQRVRQ